MRSKLLASCIAIASVLLLSALPGPASAAGHPASTRAHRALAIQQHRRHHPYPRKYRLLKGRYQHGSGNKVSNAVAVTSTASTSTATDLFDGSHIGDFWVNHSAPGAITETIDPAGSGEKVLQMTVGDGDVYPITPTENPRAELLSPGIIKSGDEFWLSTKFFIPQDYPAVPSSGWVSLVSIYGAPFSGPSPWRLEISGNELQWQRNETYGYDIPWQMPLVKGRWVSVVTHERFGSDGFVEMWIDGSPIDFFSSGGYNPNHQAPTEHLSMQTMDATNDADVNSAKIMQYRKAGMFSSGTVYFGPLRLGSTRESVEA